MKRKTIIILSLLSAVFSLLYILLNYFGIIRYMSMRTDSINSYIDNYKNLDQINKEIKVIITIIATKKQLRNIKPVIKSLLDQTVKVNLISMIIPYKTNYKLPEDLSNVVAIYNCNEEKAKTGDLNSLLSTISREGEATTKVITLGAGVIYGKDFIETLLEAGEQNPNTILYIDNRKKDFIKLEKGAVFNTGFFDKDFMDIPDEVHANEWVNKYFDNKNIKKINIKYKENYKII